MKKYKNNLLSKNNYDIKFEELIERKNYDDESKSLILNIIYKIDGAYNDYKTIKPNAKSKIDIIEYIDNVIDYKCDLIELINPQDSKKKISVNKKNKIIRIFPRDIDLLQAIYYISTPNAKKSSNLFEKAIEQIIEKGISVNGAEIIRDFNGWSWNNTLEDEYEKYYNIIYQNLIMLLGEQETEALLKSNSIVDELYKQLGSIYDDEQTNGFMSCFIKVCVLLFARNGKKFKDEINDYLSKKEQKLDELADKSNYTSKITDKISKDTELLCKIDATLMNPKNLNKKFEKENKNGKYKDIESFKLFLIKSKNQIQNEITSYRKMMSPFEFIKAKKNIETEVEYLREIVACCEDRDVVAKYILELQKKFIACYYKKIEVFDQKKELISLVYEVRYYNLIPLCNKTIMEYKSIKSEIEKMQNELINKLKKIRAVEIFSNYPRVNYHILKRVFETRMIDLTKIMVKYKIVDDGISVIYFDEESADNEIYIKINDDEMHGFVQKQNKKLKIIL